MPADGTEHVTHGFHGLCGKVTRALAQLNDGNKLYGLASLGIADWKLLDPKAADALDRIQLIAVDFRILIPWGGYCCHDCVLPR
jgi:hypothetical protein